MTGTANASLTLKDPKTVEIGIPSIDRQIHFFGFMDQIVDLSGQFSEISSETQSPATGLVGNSLMLLSQIAQE